AFHVTGVQTCALPIFPARPRGAHALPARARRCAARGHRLARLRGGDAAHAGERPGARQPVRRVGAPAAAPAADQVRAEGGRAGPPRLRAGLLPPLAVDRGRGHGAWATGGGWCDDVDMSEMSTPAPLEPLNEEWERGLAIVAHPDDLEFGAAAAIARWTGQGKHIVYVLLTSGEAGIDGIPPERSGPLREQEQRASAAVVGVDEVEFAGFPDGVLEYGLPLRKAVARAVRRHRPEVVITSNVRDTWDDATALNQADHIA